MEELNFLSWMEPFIKPRQSSRTYTSIKKRKKEEPVFEDTLEPGEIEVSGSDSESVSGAKSTSKDVTIGIKRKIKCYWVENMSKQKQKDLEILESLGQTAKAFTLSEKPVRDEHNIFSELMAKK